MIETFLTETSVHGRTLVRRARSAGTVIGFHGFAETAAIHLAELEQIPGAQQWTLAAVQALHPFYARGGKDVVASWMTREDRAEAIADNVAYVRRVVERLDLRRPLVFGGFSQGAAMAWRAAAAIPCEGLFVLGGDIPPDVTTSSGLPPALIGRGVRDEWYTAEKFEQDLRFLGDHPFSTSEFEGGHEWSSAFRDAVAEFLRPLAGLGSR